MPDVLIEENGKYYFDCHNAIWATDEIHTVYHSCGLPEILSDADFAIETEDSLPFQLQKRFDTEIRLIDSVSVLNISEWNLNTDYGRYPILPVSQLPT